jgi:phage N-6-adenine-methyltransferase
MLVETETQTRPKRRRPSTGGGGTKQDYGTPREFIAAVERRFGPIAIDLAAHAGNHVVPTYFGPGSAICEDSLERDWTGPASSRGTLWLNPPFANIAPWAAKCSGARDRLGWILLLVPASIGSVWFAEHVEGKAMVLGLSPRLTFVGETAPYPKDLLLAAFGFGLSGFGTWRWK